MCCAVLCFSILQVISNYHLYVASRACGVDKYLRAAALSNGKQTLMFSPSGRTCVRTGNAALSCWNLGVNPCVDTPYEGFRPDVNIDIQRKTIRSQPTTPAVLTNNLSQSPHLLSPPLSLPVSISTPGTPYSAGSSPPPSATAPAKEPRGWFKKSRPGAVDTSHGNDDGGKNVTLIERESDGTSTRAVEGAGLGVAEVAERERERERAGGSGQSKSIDGADKGNILTSTTFSPVASCSMIEGSQTLDRIPHTSTGRGDLSLRGSPIECLSRNTVSPLNNASYSDSCNDSTNDGSDERCRKRTKGRKGPVDTGYVGVSTVTVKVKALADLVEALIGAFYMEGGVQGGVAAIMALGAWPGMIRHEAGSEPKMNGSNNVSRSGKSNITGSDGHTLSNSKGSSPLKVTIPIGYNEHSGATALGESPPTAALREIICPASAAVCATMEQKLGYRFTDPCLLALALTHSSVSKNSNQRLEFLGDAVLDFVVVRELHR